ncbi:MAG: hypothetical protein ACK4YP_18155, partial [Myxococcota bacterium]
MGRRSVVAVVGGLAAACAAREEPPEAPVMVYKASPSPTEEAASSPTEEAIARLHAALDALERAPADREHTPEQAVMARLAEAVEATAPDPAAGQAAAGEIRRLAARLDASHHASDRHADWMEAAFLAALGPVRSAATDRWDLAEPLVETERAVTAL